MAIKKGVVLIIVLFLISCISFVGAVTLDNEFCSIENGIIFNGNNIHYNQSINNLIRWYNFTNGIVSDNMNYILANNYNFTVERNFITINSSSNSGINLGSSTGSGVGNFTSLVNGSFGVWVKPSYNINTATSLSQLMILSFGGRIALAFGDNGNSRDANILCQLYNGTSFYYAISGVTSTPRGIWRYVACS